MCNVDVGTTIPDEIRLLENAHIPLVELELGFSPFQAIHTFPFIVLFLDRQRWEAYGHDAPRVRTFDQRVLQEVRDTTVCAEKVLVKVEEAVDHSCWSLEHCEDCI
jgi:hypothetical protein